MNSNFDREYVNRLERVVRTRRSVFPKSFTDEPIDDRLIEKMIAAANWAPTHRLTQPWRFVVIRGDARKRFANFLLAHYDEATPVEDRSEVKRKKTYEKPMQSQAIIAICMRRDPNESVPEWEEIAAVGAAVQNLWLTVHAYGLGGYWSSPGSIHAVGSFLDLEEGTRCLGYFYLGCHDQPPKEGVRDPWEEKVKWLK